MSRDLRFPERAEHGFDSRVQHTELQRRLALLGIARERFRRGPAGVGDDHIHRTTDGSRHPFRCVGGSEAVHAASLGQQIRDQDDWPAHLGERFLHTAHEQRRHEAGKEATRPDDHRVERSNRFGHHWVNGYGRLEPDPPDFMSPGLPGVDFHLATCGCSIRVLGADRRALDTDGKDAPAAAKQTSQSIHGGQKVAAVGFHHGQQQVAAGVPGQTIVLLQRGQSRQQHVACFPFVARQRERALQHVARRQHAELIAKLTGTAAAVEHRHDSAQAQPWVALEAAKQTRQTRAATHAPDVHLAKSHGTYCTALEPGPGTQRRRLTGTR